MLAAAWIRIPLQCPKVCKVKESPKHSLKFYFELLSEKKILLQLINNGFQIILLDGTWAATELSMNKKTEAMAFQWYEFFSLCCFVSLRQEIVLFTHLCRMSNLRQMCTHIVCAVWPHPIDSPVSLCGTGSQGPLMDNSHMLKKTIILLQCLWSHHHSWF